MRTDGRVKFEFEVKSAQFDLRSAQLYFCTAVVVLSCTVVQLLDCSLTAQLYSCTAVVLLIELRFEYTFRGGEDTVD